MLGLILGVHAGAPQPMALEPQQEEEGCASISPNVPAAWCDTTCGPSPRSDQCKGICKCPVAELSKVPAPPAPEPRIVGGWTNCGPDSGVEEWLARRNTSRSRSCSPNANPYADRNPYPNPNPNPLTLILTLTRRSGC